MSDTTHLPPVGALEIVRAALSELQVAECQIIPSDDQIIAGHVRVAIALLKPVAYPKVRE
jgi:hypothetical protein